MTITFIFELLNDPPKLELGDGLVNILGPEAEDILDDEIVNKKELEDEVLENIKEEYCFEEIKDAFDEASVPHRLEFSYGGINEHFIQACYLFHLIMATKGLLLFLYLEKDKT